MKKLTTILESRYTQSAQILQAELNEYNNKMSKKLPKQLVILMQLIGKEGIEDKDLLDSLLTGSNASIEAVAKSENMSYPNLLDISKLLKANKDKLKLLPFYQTSFEREMIMKGKLSMDDALMDLETELGRNMVAKRYMPLAHKISNSFEKRSALSKSELLSAALEGLTIAMNRYKQPEVDLKDIDSDLGVDDEELKLVGKEEKKKKEQTFLQYAAYMIKFYILNEISHASRTVRMSRNAVKAAMADDKTSYNFVSIDKSVSKEGEGGAGILDLIPDLNTNPNWNIDFEEDKSWKKIYDSLSKVFSARDMNVFYKFFGLNGHEKKKGKDLAKEINVSAPSITHIVSKIIKYMSTSKDSNIKNMLDDLNDAYMNECLRGLSDYSVKTIEESLISDPIIMVFEEIITLKGGKRWEIPITNAIEKIKSSNDTKDVRFYKFIEEYVSNRPNSEFQNFEFVDSKYKKNKAEVVLFLSSINPAGAYSTKSDFSVSDTFVTILDLICTYKLI